MFTRISEYITQQLENENIIISENREIYRYGIQIGLVITLNLITSLLIGAIFGELIFSILLLAVYIPLRTYSGGYHASTTIRCYIVSSAIMVAWLSIFKWVKLPTNYYAITFFFSIIICWYLSPVDTKNKAVDDLEKKVFKKKSHTILFIYSMVYFILYYYSTVKVIIIITLTVCSESLMLVLGKVKNKIEN